MFEVRKMELMMARGEHNPFADALPFKVSIDRYKGIDYPTWRIIGFYHLKPSENTGKNNLYISALDENGERIYTPPVWIDWDWIGRQQHEPARDVKLDKPHGEPMGNINLGAGQIVTVSVETGQPKRSDIISGIHTGWDSDGPGNSRFHHSFFVVFQRQLGANPPPDEEEPDTGGNEVPEVRLYTVEDDKLKIEIKVTIKP